MVQDSDDCAPRRAATDRVDTSPTAGLVFPTTPINAVVRHSEPPEQAPHDLEPYVVRIEGEYGAAWVLTTDVVAFAEADVPQRFRAWTENWQRTWVLDPRSNFECLADYCAEVAGPASHHGEVERFVQQLTQKGEIEIGGTSLKNLAAAIVAVADELRERDRRGVGIVDASDRPRGSGLVRAWPHFRQPKVVAADQHLRLTVSGDVGMSLFALVDGVVGEEVTPVEQVEIDDVVTVTGPNRSQPLVRKLDHARPLAWIAPGAGRWRARPAPEVVAYAKTFGGIGECAQYAGALRLGVRFTTSPPVQAADDLVAESST